MNRYPSFRVRFRGFDQREVVSALAKLASENEEARREINRLGKEIDRLQGSVTEQAGNDRHVQRALVAASKAADDIRERAEEEARRILREAEERGALVVQQSRDEARALEEQVHALLARRREVETSIESFLKVMSDELEHSRRPQPDESASGTLARTG